MKIGTYSRAAAHAIRAERDRKHLVEEKRAVEERLRMVTRARKVMAECNRVLVRASDESQLLQDMCRIVVETGGYRLAWIGMVEHDAEQTIRPVASGGEHAGHLATTKISWGGSVAGQGPAGAAVRERKPQAARHLRTDPYFSTRRPHVIERGFEAAAALPLLFEDAAMGVLGILASEPEAFDADELALLEDLAHHIAYGISNLRRLVAQRRDERLLKLEHTVTRCLADADSAAAVLKAVMRAVCETQGWECGRYFRADDAAGMLRFDEGWGVPSAGIERFLERSRSVTYGPGVGVIGRAWQSGEPLWIADLSKDSRALRAAYTVDSGIRAAFLIPVASEGRTIGVLAFASREIREPDERLLQAVRVIGSQIGQFLHRVGREDELSRFRAAMDTSSDMILLVDRTTMRYIDANATACEMQGYTREELLRLGPQDVGGIERGALERAYDEMIATGQTTWEKSTHRRKDGTLVPIEVFRRAVRTDRGWIIVSVLRDVSERVRAEQLQNLEHAVAHILAESDSAPEALTAVMRAMCATEGWECGRYFRVDETANVLRFDGAWHAPDSTIASFVEASRSIEFARGCGLSGRAWESGRPLWSTDIQNDPRVLSAALFAAFGMRGAVDFPVTAAGRTIGVLAFSSRQTREPDDRLLRAVDAIGSQIGQFLQRKQAEAVMRESEARFRSLNQLSSDMYWEQDEQYRFTTLAGTGPGPLPRLLDTGRRRWDRDYVNMTPASWVAHIADLEARRPFRDLELCRLDATGRQIWVSTSGEPKFDAAGNFTGYRGVGKDITARKREQQLLALGHTVNRLIAEAESVSGALQAAMRAICESEGWDCGRYFRMDEAAGVLRFAEAWHVPEPALAEFVERSREAEYAPGAGLVGRAWQSGQPLWSTDLGNDPRAQTRRYSLDIGIRAAFVFPVTAEGRTIGLFSFSSRKASDPDDGLLRAVSAIGSHIGQFVQRKQAEAVVRESEARFRSLTTLSSDWYWEQDAEYRFVDMTSEIDRMTGVKALTHIGKRRWELAAPNMTEADWAAHRAMIEAHQPFEDLELCRVADGGSLAWVSISGEPIFDTAGRCTGYRGIGRDITARKREDQLLKLEHTVTRRLAEADTVPAGLTAVVRAVCETEGWSCGRYFDVDEAAGVARFSCAWGVPDAAVENFIARSRDLVYRPGKGLTGQAWQSGEPLWVTDVSKDPRASGSFPPDFAVRGSFVCPVIFEGKTLGVLSFNSREMREPDPRLQQAMRVIASQTGQYLQRKRNEEIVRESEARFRSLTTLSSDWYWEQDAQYRFVDMTSEVDRPAGASPFNYIGRRRWEMPSPNMTEADWAAHRALVESHQAFHDLELCRRDASGAERWVSVSGEPIFDAAGRFKGYRGIGKDITARKREHRLLALEHAVTRSLADADSAAAGLNAVLRIVCETEGWECGRFFSLDHNAGLLRFREAWGVRDDEIDSFIEISRDLSYAAGVGLAGRVWQTGQPVWVADITRDARVSTGGRALESGIRGAFVFPLISEGRTMGVLIFNSREVREPEERLLQAIRVIGSQIGQFVQRTQAEEKMRDHARQQRLIAEFGQEAFASAELTEVLSRAAQLSADTLGVEYASVLRMQPSGTALAYEAVVGWPQEWIGSREWPVSAAGRFAHILAHGEPLVIEDYAAPGHFSPSRLLEYGVRSGILVPIFGTKEAYGVLGIHARQTRAFTDEDVSFLRSVANILAIAIERNNVENELARLAQFDGVTGLPNRHLFRDRLGHALTQAQRNGWPAGVLFVDLDRFKAVNDTFGHAVGDCLLREVATRLKDCVRTGDTVARLSGDEFAVVLSSLSKDDDAGVVAQKIVNALAAAFHIDGHQAYVSASVGIALYPGDGSEADALIKNADTAMYRAKQQGRNGYQFYLPQMNERLLARARLDAQLRGALDRGEYRLHYQPKVQLDTGAMSGFEALLRWQQDDKLVSPAEFIPILEETGLIVPVGEWVLRTVCEQIKLWKEQGIVPRPVAVNLSARQFQQKDLATMIRQVLHETGVEPDLLELELTETLLMSDAGEAVQMLRELKRLGVRLAIDDFGTGYSSLAYLKRFPLDTLKIDRAFIRDVSSSPDDAALMLTIINLAHSMRLKVVAEGVETREQLNFLRLHGCDDMQGYYFARPLEVEDCTRALIEDRRLQCPVPQRNPDAPALLLVDDSEDDLALLEQALASDHFQILTANSPQAGFELLARHGADVVISDHLMPGMSGIEFLSSVKKLYPDAVRVVATGNGDVSTLTRAINHAGVHKFLSKNWDAERLRGEVWEAYRQHR